MWGGVPPHAWMAATGVPVVAPHVTCVSGVHASTKYVCESESCVDMYGAAFWNDARSKRRMGEPGHSSRHGLAFLRMAHDRGAAADGDSTEASRSRTSEAVRVHPAMGAASAASALPSTVAPTFTQLVRRPVCTAESWTCVCSLRRSTGTVSLHAGCALASHLHSVVAHTHAGAA